MLSIAKAMSSVSVACASPDACSSDLLDEKSQCFPKAPADKSRRNGDI